MPQIKRVVSDSRVHAEQSPIGVMIVLAMGVLEFLSLFIMLAGSH